jgi:DNA (cytosine-5)-methyltransferase 1
MTDSPTPRRGRPPKYAHLNQEELRELARKQAAERQARKRGRDQAEAAATEMVLRTLSDALLYSAKEGLVDPVALLDSLKVGRGWPTKPEVEAGVGFDEAERIWTKYKRVFLEALAEGRGSLIPPGVGDPLADPSDEEWQRLAHPPWQGYFPNGREDAKIRFLSLFSGVGAPDLAFCRRGWRCLGHAEIEDFPSAVLAERFPDIRNYGDITKVDWVAERERIGPIHVVVGGPPCQSFSGAGRGGGMDDVRGELTLRFIDVARDLGASAFIFENVDRILSAPSGKDVSLDLKGRDFALLLKQVSDAGYSAAWGVFEGTRFGTPQSRKRVFMVGIRTNRWEWPALAAFGPNIDIGSPEAALRSLPGSGRKLMAVPVGDDPLSMAAAVDGKWPKAGILHRGVAMCIERLPEGWPEAMPLLPYLDRHVARPSVLGPDAVASLFRRFGHDANPVLAPLWQKARALRDGGDADAIEYVPDHAGTITKSRGVNQRGGLRSVVAPGGGPLRRFSSEEKERLQGFPSGWTDIVYMGKRATLEHRDGAVGNSMVVNVLGHLADYLDLILPEIIGDA